MSKDISLHYISYNICVLFLWLSFKNFIIWRLGCECKSSKSVHNQIDPEHLNGIEGGALQDNGSEEHNKHCDNIDR